MAETTSGSPGDPSARLVMYGGQRAIGIRWRAGARCGELSTDTRDRDQALGIRAVLLRDLQDGRIPGKDARGPAVTWREFRERYETTWLHGMSEGSRNGWRTAANHLERTCSPKRLHDVDRAMLNRFRAAMEETGVSPVSVKSYYAAIHAGLAWAYDEGLIEHVPRIRMRKTGAQLSTMRSRPITGEEFERMLAAAADVRPNDWGQFCRFLRGMYHSGLRISELAKLSKHTHDPLHVAMHGRPRLIVILGAQKNRADSALPAPPEFWDLVAESYEQRGDLVFPVLGRRRGLAKQMTTRSIGRVISEIGQRAGVIVSPARGKRATSHDLRATYLSRIAGTSKLSAAQKLGRHATPETTAKYYVRHEAEELAASLGWT